MPLPTANPTTGKTHVAEKDKFHQGGSLKAYSHEELGTADDVREALRSNEIEWHILMYCVISIELVLQMIAL
jgi:hypothetical protein